MAVIAARPAVPALDPVDPLKDVHARMLAFKRDRQTPTDVREIKTQAQRFDDLDRKLDEAAAMAPGYDRNHKIAQITSNWRNECANYYRLNTNLHDMLGYVNNREWAVLRAIGMVPENVLEFRDVDYKEEELVKKVKEISNDFQKSILDATTGAFKSASKIAQKLNLPLEIAPIPVAAVRRMTFSEIIGDTLILTAKKMASFVYNHPYFIPMSITAATIALRTDLAEGVGPTVEILAEGVKTSLQGCANAVPAAAKIGVAMFMGTTKFFTPKVGMYSTAAWTIPPLAKAVYNGEYAKARGLILLGAASAMAPIYVKPGFVKAHMTEIGAGAMIAGAGGVSAAVASKILPQHPRAAAALGEVGKILFIGAALAGNAMAGHEGLITQNPAASLAVAAAEVGAIALISESRATAAVAGTLLSAAAYKGFGLAAGMAAGAITAGAMASNFVNSLREKIPAPGAHPNAIAAGNAPLINGPNPRYPAKTGYAIGGAIAGFGLVSSAVTQIGKQAIKDGVKNAGSAVVTAMNGHPYMTAAAAATATAIAAGTLTGHINRNSVRRAGEAGYEALTSNYTTAAAAVAAVAGGTTLVASPVVAGIGATVVAFNTFSYLSNKVVDVAAWAYRNCRR